MGCGSPESGVRTQHSTHKSIPGISMKFSEKIFISTKFAAIKRKSQGNCYFCCLNKRQPSGSSGIMKNEQKQYVKGKRVLLAEDNIFTQRLISLILQKWGVELDIACNGCQAVEMVRQNHYDLVMMDIMMPEMDGYSAVKAIREMDDQAKRALPVFAFSVTPDMELIREYKMNGHISKSPFDKEELLGILCKYPGEAAENGAVSAGSSPRKSRQEFP